MKANLGRVVAGLLAVLAVLSPGSACAEELQVILKSTSTIEVPEGVKKIMVSDPKVLDVQASEDGKRVLVTGLELGAGEVRVMRLAGADLVYRITVQRDASGLGAQIKELLRNVEGVEIRVVGDRVVLDGKLLTKSDYDRVKSVAEAYKGMILDLTRLDRAGLDKFVADAIMRDIDMDTVTAKVVGETATLEGFVFDEAELKRATQLAKLRCPEVVNLLRVEEVMIETDIYFLQIDTAKSSETGFNVLKTLGVELAAGAEFGTDVKPTYSMSLNASAAAKIHALMGSGQAQILAQPHLSTKSGGEGSFHSGGETYFEVSGVNDSKLEKVKYGIVMKVKPVLRGKDRIMNEITIEVSVPTATSKNAFSLDKFETSSVTMCKVGESIIVSGLAQTLENRFKEKTPLLGSIPLLNLFFAESRKSKQGRELFVMLTPKPVFPSTREGPSYSEERSRLTPEGQGKKR